MTVGGVGGSQFKTIIPLTTQQNVQQIQVPGSRFHYVRLVTATTSSSPGQPSTSSMQTGEQAGRRRRRPQTDRKLTVLGVLQGNPWWAAQESGCRSLSFQLQP